MSPAGRVLLGCATVLVLLGAIGVVGAVLEGDGGGTAATVPRATAPVVTEPTPEPTRTPTPTPQPTAFEVTISDALAAGLVDLTATGRNLQQLEITLDSTTAQPLDVVVPAGLVFAPSSGSTQPMVVISHALVFVEPGGSASWTLDVACASMDLDQPDDSDSFGIATEATSKDLQKLVGLDPFADASFRVQQFAVWTITDDPSRSGYVGLGTFGVGSGPSDDELAEITDLFKQAGIDPSKYRALR